MSFAIMNKYEAYVQRHNLKDNSIKTKGRKLGEGKLCYLINVFHIAYVHASAKLICSIKRRRLSIVSIER